MQVTLPVSAASREPRQGRSRASYERMLTAAEKLMVKTQSDEFTLMQVAKTGKVSIGSIYLRFDSKDDLIRAMHVRVLERVDEEQRAWLERIDAESENLGDFVSRFVEAFAESLRRYAPVLRPMMLRASTDRQISGVGKGSHDRFAEAVKARMLTHAGGDGDTAARRRINSAYRVIYSTLARYLGFGTIAEVAGEGDWEELKQDLAAMCAAFLRSADKRA